MSLRPSLFVFLFFAQLLLLILLDLRSRVQTWVSGLISEVRKKSPSVVQRLTELRTNLNAVGGDEPAASDKSGAAKVELNPAGIKTTIKTKIKLNELYDKLSKPKDITSLFRPGGGGAGGSGGEEAAENRDMDQNANEENTIDLEDEEVGGYFKDNDLSVTNNSLGLPASASSPRISQDEEPFQFSFEDFSIENSDVDLLNRNNINIESQKENHLPQRSTLSCHGNGGGKKRSNIGEIGRSVSTNTTHRDEKRNLLSDIGRRFSQMDESTVDCEFKSNSLGYENRSLGTLRQSSLSVSPIPRLLCPSNHRHSTDLSGQKKRNSLFRDFSTQSDSSRCSSVESLLEARKPDAETILINLGFGPVQSDDVLTKIPKRFLKPSQVNGIDTDTFLKQQQLANNLHDHSVLGYRGLVGNPHIPPSLIVAKIMQRFQANEKNRCLMTNEFAAGSSS